MFLIAITRPVSSSIDYCELSQLKRQKIDIDVAREQHHQYEETLQDLGAELHRLPLEERMPDSVFVEDTAIVLDELAIITRPGAEPRRLETKSVAKILSSYKRLYYIQVPGTIDGGDVLQVDKTLYIGISNRTNEAGIKQLEKVVQPFGYVCKAVKVRDCLHLKSAVSLVHHDALLINRDLLDSSQFSDINLIDVDLSEPRAGNALLVGDTVIIPEAFPKTRERLEKRGIKVKALDVSELAKAEGGVTCCSVIFEI